MANILLDVRVGIHRYASAAPFELAGPAVRKYQKVTVFTCGDEDYPLYAYSAVPVVRYHQQEPSSSRSITRVHPAP